MKRFYVLLLSWFGAIGLAHATTYYCSPTGTGDGNSYATPCSFSKGLNRISQPGDTLYLLGGQYDLQKTTLNYNGTKSKMLVISGYPGEQAILDFRKVTYGTRGLQISKTSTYVHIKNLTLRYSGKNNLYNEGSYCRFENLDIYGSADSGCQMKGGGNNLIINCDSHDNFDYELGGLTACDFGGNADGFADKQHTGAPNHYIGCRSWNNSDDGWDFFDRTCTGTIIENCICYQNGPQYYDMRNHARYQTDKAWFDQFQTPITVTTKTGEKKTCSLEKYYNNGNGNGFKVGGNYSRHDVTVHHCLAIANRVKGFDQNNDDGTMEFYNCTGYDNGANFGFTTKYGQNILVNNLSYNSRGSESYRAQTVLRNEYNSWNDAIHPAANTFASMDTTVLLGQRQADGALPEWDLLHPLANSPLIDAGTPLTYTYYGQAPELGCYEYVVGEPVIPDPGPQPKPEDTTGIKIAYVTVPNAAADQRLLQALKADATFYIKVIDAGDELHLDGCQAVILSPVPKSTAYGAQSLKDTSLPFLCLKPFMGKNTVWNWCTPANTAESTITVTAPNHPLFANLPGTFALYSKVSTNGVATMSNWLLDNITTLATCKQADAIVEHNKMLMLGLSEYSLSDITDEGIRLIRNALYYITDTPYTPLVSPRWEDRPTKYLRNGVLYIRHHNRQINILGEVVGSRL
ncbi:MAG: right-handed parallel beta-helix repeat-containing protein [Paludibacteraceae bacterium]|nr:right-handed parallel beta-helix repeat-containing protein [Paludibacteraceae bacterium]